MSDYSIDTSQPHSTGITCPACGCPHTSVRTTDAKSQAVMRYRKCLHCSTSFRTRESYVTANYVRVTTMAQTHDTG